jgi:hypothetical protein
MWRIGWAPNSIPIYIQQDATLNSLFIIYLLSLFIIYLLSTSVLEKHTSSFFRVKVVFCTEYWGNKFLSAISQ